MLLEEELDALRVLIDHALLPRLDDAPVELHVADGDAELFCFLDLLPDVRVLEQRLGGDAAAMETGASDERVLLDDRDLQAELPGADTGHVASRSAADDDDVVLLICQDLPPVKMQRGCGAARIICR